MATTTTPRDEAAVEAPPVILTYAQFDTGMTGDLNSTLEVVRDGVPIAEWTPLTPADFTPRGGTPLYDAVGLMVAHMEGVQRAHPEAAHVGVLVDRSGSMSPLRSEVVSGINEFVGAMQAVKPEDVDAQGTVMLLVYTDGGENSSVEFDADAVKRLVKGREKKGWEFIYLGANQDAWSVGGSMGIGTSTGYVASASGSVSALRTVGNYGAHYLSNNSALASRSGAISSSALADGEVREIPDEGSTSGS